MTIMKPNKIPKIGHQQLGFITNIVFWMFFWLKYLPPQCFLEERITHQIRISGLTEDEKNKAIQRRINITEIIILGYIVIYALSIIFNHYVKALRWLEIFNIAIVVLRLIDIIQTNVNITLFDYLRSDASNKINNNVYSPIRTIVLVCYNFLEIALIFGICYSLMPSALFLSKNCLSLYDKFYFSFVTQLTIGYGDITPMGAAKILACIQGICGYFFSILIISRFLASLPKVEALKK
jgi:hypothetical protein